MGARQWSDDNASRGRRARRLLVPVLGLAALGCSRNADPRVSGGERLPSTHDVRGTSPECFYPSPDGRWLLFESLRDTGDLPAYTIYDLSARTARPAGWSRDAADAVRAGHGPLPDGFCLWRSGRVEIGGDAGIGFTLDPSASVPEWELRAPDGPEQGPEAHRRARQPASDAQRLYVVARRSERAAEIVAAGGANQAPLAEHTAHDAATSRLDIAHLRLAPRGDRLAYVVMEHQRAFLLPPRGYVLALDHPGRPRLLAAPVLGAPRWQADSDGLLACVGGGPRTRGIYLWRLDE